MVESLEIHWIIELGVSIACFRTFIELYKKSREPTVT